MVMVSGPVSRRAGCVELHSGDRMNRAEFHRLYEQTPEDFRAELIGGIVYVPSPLKRPHGSYHVCLTTLFGLYEARTPGVEAADNATILLGDQAEPQPDLCLRIAPEFGGQSSTTEDDYILGAPELVAEVAHSSRAIDLHRKRRDYRRHGVQEYLVLCLQERELRWFEMRADQLPQPGADGVYRLHSFPGLWIHGTALLARDYGTLLHTLEQGLATPEHQEFVKQLAAVKA